MLFLCCGKKTCFFSLSSYVWLFFSFQLERGTHTRQKQLSIHRSTTKKEMKMKCYKTTTTKKKWEINTNDQNHLKYDAWSCFIVCVKIDFFCFVLFGPSKKQQQQQRRRLRWNYHLLQDTNYNKTKDEQEKKTKIRPEIPFFNDEEV